MNEQDEQAFQAAGKFLSVVPHAQSLGMRLVAVSGNVITLELPYSEYIVGDPRSGVIFGGAIVTLLDQACGVAIPQALGVWEPCPTLDLRIDYLRSARPRCPVFGRAEVYHVTNHVVFVTGTAYQELPEQVVASCAATFARIDPKRRRTRPDGTGE